METIKKHLSERFNKKIKPVGIETGGSWQGKDGYDHIMKLENPNDKDEKYETVCKWIKALGVSPCDFEKGKMHQLAHHLNSSQVVCYVFFKHLMESGRLAEFVRKVLGDKVNTDNLKCEFEYVPKENADDYGRTMATNYDCRISNESFELLIEVKYTEKGFGTCETDETHRIKFEKVYCELIKECSVINEDAVGSFEDMRPYYQIIRNLLQIREDKKLKTYCLFLYPEANDSINKDFLKFKGTNILKDGEPGKNVFNMNWEKFKDLMTDKFRDVYFPEPAVSFND